MANSFTNWGGNLQFTPNQFLYPSTEEEIVTIVKQAINEGRKVRIVGTGHSWTELVKTDDYLISLKNYQGLLEVDTTQRTATVKAGTVLNNLGELLYEKGLAMENLGDIDVQSIAGSISTGTHGTGVNFGTLSTQLMEITFVNGKGELITCSEYEEKELFKAAQVSLGALGIITRLKLRLVPAYKLHYTHPKADLDDTLERLEEYKNNNRNFEFYWFPYTKNVQLKFINQTEEGVQGIGIMKWLNDVVLENFAFGILSRFARAFPAKAKNISAICGSLISDGKVVNHSHRIFATVRMVKFNEMEYNIPAEHFEEVIKAMEAAFEKHQFEVHFPIECRWVKGDDIMISPASGRDSAYIAIHQYRGMDHKPYFDTMEQIFRTYGGRPHYGKMNTASYEEFSRMYPNWEQFRTIRQQMDPNGVFLNTYLRRIFRVPKAG